MTDREEVERPSAWTYLFSGVTLGDDRVTVACAVCKDRIGLVANTPYGPIWVGFLHNRRGRKDRTRMFGLPGGYNVITLWAENWRPQYFGECQCPRNSVPGALVWPAWLQRKRRILVPPQDDRPSA